MIDIFTKSSTRRGPLAALTLLALSSCGGEPTPPDVEDPIATTLTVNPETVTFDFLNATRSLNASVLDQNGQPFTGATVNWDSDNATVASVSSAGLVTALANGTAEITATTGTLSATVTVTVEQVARFLFVQQGDEQEAVQGTTLPDEIVVLAQDAAGAPVPDAVINFTPEASDGTVSVSSVGTDADGEASTAWTLASRFGKHRMVIELAGSDPTVDVDVIAWSRDVVPRPDLVAGEAVTAFRADPSSLESFEVRNTVRNEGDGASGTYTVKVLADGAEVASEEFGPLERDEEETVILAVGPLDAGERDLTVVIDADDAVSELIESNNEAQDAIDILDQVVTQTGTTTGLGVGPDGELLFRLTVPAGSPRVLTVSINGADGDADLFIEGGKRPSGRTGFDDCVGAGPTSVERCQLLDPEGDYHIILWAAQEIAFSDLELEITLDDNVIPYNLELVFVESGTASQNAAFEKAADRWSEILIGDIPDQVFSTQFPYPAGTCISGQGELTQPIDDLRIYVSIRFIDGPLGVLGRAATCVRRHQTELPVIGFMQFDQADLERLELDGDMDPVILHEMGHIIGIGTIWQLRGLLESPSANNPGADTHFRGPRAIAAFDAVGGTTYTGGGKVPVENLAGPGSSDGHWREAVFDEEMMSPFLDTGVFNPLSLVTVESLADLGYLVDLAAADAYTLPSTSPAVAAEPSSTQIDLSNDYVWGPVAIVDERGRIIEIRDERPGMRPPRR